MAKTTYVEALRQQESTGHLWDDEGNVATAAMETLREEFSDRNPDRELTGSPQDWADFRALATELDAKARAHVRTLVAAWPVSWRAVPSIPSPAGQKL